MNPTLPSRVTAREGLVALSMVTKSPLHVAPRSVVRRTRSVWLLAPAGPSPQATYATRLCRGSTAVAKELPIRWLPMRVHGPVQGICTDCATRTPALPSPGSISAPNGDPPAPNASSRTTTTSALTGEVWRQLKYAA